jgi:peptide/nickel transport system substrate-binding protein
MANQPYLDQVQVHLFSDVQAMVTQFEAGVLNAMFNPLLTDTVRLQKNSQYQIVSNPVPSSDVVIAMNTSNPPLDNKQVRQALNYALNRSRFTQSVMQGMTQPISLPWPPQSPAYDASKNQTYAFNLDKAKSLLAASGVSGLQFDFLYSSISPELASLAQMYQADLASIGVQLNLKPLESAVFNDQTNSRKYTGLAASNAGFVQLEPSSLAALSVWFKPDTNNEAFSSSQYGQLINSASVEPDASKRLQLYGQLNDLLLDESFVIIPSYLTQLVVTTSNMHGLQWRLGQSVRYEETWIG